MLVDIKGYEGRYQISDTGQVWSCYKKGFMSLTQRAGYPWVILYKDGKQKGFSVHRLVAEAFLPNPDNLPIVNHKDENKMNNNVDNLEWCSHSYNNTYGKGFESRAEKQSKTTYQYDLDYNLIAVYPSTQQAYETTGISSGQISEVARGIHKQTNGFIFSYEPLDKPSKDS